MKSIWKFHLPLTDSSEIEMPSTAEILKVGLQGDSIFIWALVVSDSQWEVEKRSFRIYGTGHRIEQDDLMLKYLDTVFLSNGLVFHVFEDAL